MTKSQSDNVGTPEIGTEFCLKSLQSNAAIYHRAKRMVDAASTYDCVDDAIVALTEAWETLEKQVENGGGFTPPSDAGFGSDNAAVIAESLLGRRNSVGATRKAFNNLGK